VEIRLTQGQAAVVDDDDADLATSRWYAWKVKYGKTFYAVRNVRKPDGKRTTERLHQVIAGRMCIAGVPDHIDRNGLNNRRDNLRPANDSQNQANQSLQTNNTSGFKGVCWGTRDGKWMAYITVSRKRRYLGVFGDPIEAARAYDRAAEEAFGEFAFLNFPDAQQRSL